MIVPSVFLDAWATALGRACWQGGLVVLAVWSICRLMRSMPARFHCWFWRLAMLKFLLVLLCPFPLSLPLLPAPLPDAAEPVALALSASDLPVNPRNQVSGSESHLDRAAWFEAALFAAWIIGVVWSIARLLAAWRNARRLREGGKSTSCSSIVEQVKAQERLFGLRTSPQLLEVPGCGSPMIIGVLRPVIVIPIEPLGHLTASERIMVLGHELAHIRRGDLFWSFVAALVRAVFFFHPLVWLSQRQLNLAQEIAADELAIARQQHDPINYGKLLVSVVGKLSPGRMVPSMSMGTTGPVESLTRRLVAMTLFGRASRKVVIGSGVLLGAVVLLGLIPWRLVAAEPKACTSTNVEDSADDDGLDSMMRRLPSDPKRISPAPPALPRALRSTEIWVQAEPHETQYRIAVVRISERQESGPEWTLAAPKMVFRVGHPAYMVTTGTERHVGVMIRSLPNTKPVEHIIRAKIIKNPENQNPAVSMARMTVKDGMTGSMVAAQENGTTVRIEATISAIKPNPAVNDFEASHDNEPGKPAKR